MYDADAVVDKGAQDLGTAQKATGGVAYGRGMYVGAAAVTSADARRPCRDDLPDARLANDTSLRVCFEASASSPSRKALVPSRCRIPSSLQSMER